MNEAVVALVRRHDPDRFLTALFAPPDRRDALLTLYAFNHELARARSRMVPMSSSKVRADAASLATSARKVSSSSRRAVSLVAGSVVRAADSGTA